MRAKARMENKNKLFGLLFTYSFSSTSNYETDTACTLHIYSAFSIHTSMCWYLQFTSWILNFELMPILCVVVIFVVSLQTRNWRSNPREEEEEKNIKKEITQNATAHSTLMSPHYLCNAEAIDYPIWIRAKSIQWEISIFIRCMEYDMRSINPFGSAQILSLSYWFQMQCNTINILYDKNENTDTTK